MATLVAVHDAEPTKRGVDDIITDPAPHGGDGQDEARERRPGPKARAKWLTGSVDDTAAQVVTAAFDEAEHRDPTHRRPWVVLVDGARHQLDLITTEAERRGVTVHIVKAWRATRHRRRPVRVARNPGGTSKPRRTKATWRDRLSDGASMRTAAFGAHRHTAVTCTPTRSSRL
ncbi:MULTISPECIES: hypothetical protein [Kitasatospora]|uniref:Transposase n=1 Tax=Kitasatospora cystarginea TaxID=58350 RepID=A0ABN3DKC6_9ACTN